MIFRRRILWSASVIAIAALAYALYLSYATKESESLTHSGAGLEWLRREHALTEQEMQAIRHAHEAYLPLCDAMCAELAAARGEMRNVFVEAGSLESIKAAQAEVNRCEQRCITMSLDHMERIAGMLPPAKKEAFRQRVLARLLGFSGDHHHIFDATSEATGHAHDGAAPGSGGHSL